MAIEDKNDKQIQDLLENNYPIKAIPIDFGDLNNRGLVLKTVNGCRDPTGPADKSLAGK